MSDNTQDIPPYGINYGGDMNDPFFNPMLQYEQGYMYYKYLTQQMEYKLKCKEYEKMKKTS